MPTKRSLPRNAVAVVLLCGLFISTAVGAPLIDFSCVGFSGDGSAPPTVAATMLVRPTGDDDTLSLQAALDAAAVLPVRADGYRGAILLAAGTFRVSGQLVMSAGGVVLRGSPDHGTTILATGHSRRTLIEIGRPEGPTTAPAFAVTDERVPAGSRVLTLASTQGLMAGEHVAITRPSTANWIADLGMKGFPGNFADTRLDWTPGSRDLIWDRVITSVDSALHHITLDAPITTSLERRYGGGFVSPITSAIPSQIGVEDLVLDSAVDAANPCDEEHAWIGVALHTVEDAWVREVTARHFAGSAVRVGPRARRVTVDRCHSEAPVSETAGYRRQSFLVEGQQTLVEHCTAEMGMNDFAVGLCAAGPNVFFDCSASGALGASGSFESWASGVLYENVRIDGAGIRLANDMTRSQGGGWTAANSVVSNCVAKEFDVVGPESAPNLLVNAGPAIYTPNLSMAKTLGTEAPTEFVFVPKPPLVSTAPAPAALQIINGRFVIGERTLWGGAVNDAWWKGEANPAIATDFGVSITRFVPGRDGPGLTENLPDLAARMESQGTPFYQSGPPLWYDRRRDEHSIVERADGNVWAPFCEFPWARSGKFVAGLGVGANVGAWDGLSRYDLTRYNPWYFEREREFADLCLQHGLVMFHSLYNTHNTLEWGAHWIDFPWRPANNINQTALPEPPPLETLDPVHFPIGPRLHLTNQFYNADDPGRRALHRAYIFHVLDQLGTSPNVIFGVAFQFTGPLAFEQFFLDTVAEWEKQNGRTVRVELATSKDITDAILADPIRSKQVSVVDLRYWQYRPDGSLYAPAGGKNLAFREANTTAFGNATDFAPVTTPEQLYRQVREYRDRYPDKAIVAWNASIGAAPILMAGGAECLNRNPTAGHSQHTVDRDPIDPLVQKSLTSILMNLKPRDGLLENPATTWCMADDSDRNVVIYSVQGQAITFARGLSGSHGGEWLNPRTGAVQRLAEAIRPRKATVIAKPTSGEWMLIAKAAD